MRPALFHILCAVCMAMPAFAPASGAETAPGRVNQAPAAAVLDTSVTGALGRKLDEYVSIIETEPAEIKCGEADFLIESCTDSLVRQFTAIRLYSHYVASSLMGDETVAIHIFDEWFAPGKVKMQNDLDFMNARIFAEFNRQSLIGMKAPALEVEDIGGHRAGLFDSGLYSDRVTVLFFYDSECPTCKMDAVMLRNILGGGKYRLNFNAFYTGRSKEKWQAFTEEYINIDNPEVRIGHFWDPEVKSDFQHKYGVLQTPRIFLISRDGTIAGRRLDVISLKRMLDLYCKPYSYGSEESSAFYDRLFSDYGPDPDCGKVKELCDSIAHKTLGSRDTVIFKQMTGDLMYWLAVRRGEGVKCGLDYLIKEYVLGKTEAWTDGNDSLKILSYAKVLEDLLGKTEIGGRLPAIMVEGTLKVRGKAKPAAASLDRLRNTVVIFHSEGCSFCEAELEAADSVAMADRRARFFIVDVDAVLDSDPDTAYGLFDAVDLSVLPYITAVDRKGRITGKYISIRK